MESPGFQLPSENEADPEANAGRDLGFLPDIGPEPGDDIVERCQGVSILGLVGIAFHVP